MSLKAARELLAGDLTEALGPDAGLVVHATVPEALEPPCVVIQAAEGFLAPGDTFDGEWSAAYDVFVCVDLLSNAQAIEDLEDALEAVLTALAGTAWGIDTVGRPGPVHTAEWVAHAVTVTVSRFVTL